jgi:hypothetical protein
VKKRIITLAVAAAVGGATAVPVGSADDGGALVSASQGVSAFFSTTSGCITTQVTIRANRDLTRMGGSRSSQTTATLELNRFDTCNGGLPLTPFYREDTIAIPDAALDVSDSLRSARLDVTLPLQEQNTGVVKPVTFHVAWLANGSKVTENTVSAGSTATKMDFSARPAVSAGIVTDGSTSFVTGPSTEAEITSASTRTSH